MKNVWCLGDKCISTKNRRSSISSSAAPGSYGESPPLGQRDPSSWSSASSDVPLTDGTGHVRASAPVRGSETPLLFFLYTLLFSDEEDDIFIPR